MTKTKRMNYREQILARLEACGWERTCVDGDTDWWVDEHWELRSVHQKFGLYITLNFLVDPHYDGSNKKIAVWMVTATTQRPSGRLDAEHDVAELQMRKGRFNDKLLAFVGEINRFRDSWTGGNSNVS